MEAMIYGVDIGSRRIAIAGPDYLLAVLRLADPRTGQHRVAAKAEVELLAGFLAAVVPAGGTIFIEQPVTPNSKRMNVGTAVRLGMTAGGLFAVHPGPGYIIDQAHWKAEVVGNGHANKDDIAAWLWREDPASAEACGGDEDLLDACCIRRYGLLVAEGRVESPWSVQRRTPRRGAVRATRRKADEPATGT